METEKTRDKLLRMPSRNRIKTYSADSYYHIYNRGVAKQTIFHEDEDYRVFLNLLKRYLDKEPHKDNRGREYEHLHDKLFLLSYCLMPNHIHLFVYQTEPDAMTKLMRGVFTSYTTYFNKKYQRVGPLFQSRYKASMIINEPYLLHISRYIHRNPKNYKNYEYSSYKYFTNQESPSWLNVDHLLGIFDDDIDGYHAFVGNFDDYKSTYDEVENELAI